MIGAMREHDPRCGLVAGRQLAALAALCAGLLAGCASSAKTFPDPESAAKALVVAVDAGDREQLREILGPQSEELLDSGDAVEDRQAAQRFIEAWEQGHNITADEAGNRVLVVGEKEWPFPIPIVKHGGGWSFDTEQGAEEILNRRIGRNELAAIQVCLAIADAQAEYARMDVAGDGLHEYARRILSDPGTRNGLFWEPAPGQPQSPLGQHIARAEVEAYAAERAQQGTLVPYHGYMYRILTAQGPHAAGGEHDYIANGRMIGGFAIVAWPARYGNSGVMTFLVNHGGVVYERDLGDETEAFAKAVEAYDPGPGWAKVPADQLKPSP